MPLSLGQYDKGHFQLALLRILKQNLCGYVREVFGQGYTISKKFLKNFPGRMKNIVFLLIFNFLYLKNFSQVTVDINSGNPKFPFPQFLDYGAGRATLASVNSPGVPHAEMEQRMKDAYQIMMNRAVYSGQTLNGVQYIHFISVPDVTEGDGYALLAAAYMADKKTFDGLWLWIHDNRMNKVRSYINCPTMITPGYKYNQLPGWTGSGQNSAADGDFDIGLALLIAWKQWGDNMGINDACGTPISYKQAALNFINAMVNLGEGDNIGDTEWSSGDIGFDGYVKGGDTWQELTGWATGQNPGPQFKGPANQHIDYYAPAYFRCFADWLQSEGQPAFNINQYRRAEASSDWMMGQMFSQNLIPVAGWVSLPGAVPSFTNFVDGEDFRTGWRTILNYVWYGNPTTSWNPVSHTVVPGGNTYERDLANLFAQFLKRPQIRGQGCDVYAAPPVSFEGVPTLRYYYSPAGAPQTTFTLNWLQGCGAPAAVASQDFDLMGEIFRQCVIEWDGTAGYLTSTPVYFHGWFRLLGMLTLSGNLHSPCMMNPSANMKVYKSVDKTYAYPGDTLTYTISYRNYGSVNATSVTITDAIPSGLSFVSASNGGTLSGSTVTWNIGTVNGLQNQNYAATQGSVTLRLKVNQNAAGRICNVATITCSNGTGWTSNEYPNNITDVMQRNCVDISTRPLYINKTSDVTAVNPGQTINYTLDFGNQSIPFLNGGRPGVNVAFANNGTAPGTQLGLKFRIYHGAHEAYINYRNYRISYFLQDATTAWVLDNTIYEGGTLAGVTVTQQNLIPGSDALGAWNQRLIIQFANQLATTTPHLLRYSGLTNRIHEGGTMMLRAVWNLRDASWANHDWTDDWSEDATATGADGDPYHPITNNWSDPNSPNIPVTRIHKNACGTVSKTVNNILVEEWDGYTWRRVLGNGPVSGREVQNVVLVDQLPANVTFVGFTSTPSIGTTTYNAATRQVRWTAPLLRINEAVQIKYAVTANVVPCPVSGVIQNVASISGTNESAARDTNRVNLTCDCIPPPVPPATSMTKTVTSGGGPYSIGAPISYSITYTNTHGAIAQPNLNSSADWTRQSGPSNFTFGSGQLTTIANQSTVMTYGYSHGTNGTLTGRINFVSSAVVGIAVRHTGGAIGNGVYVTFKPNTGAGNVEVRFWNGTTQVGATATVAVSGLGSGYFDYRLVLNGGTISLWINNFSGVALTSMTGMTVQAGYAGVINGTPSAADIWGAHSVSGWWTNLDSGFNVQMYDPVPSDVTFVSASNSGSVIAGSVTWPMTNNTTATPLLAGQTVTRTWTGTVSNCTCGGVITNTAYMRMLGISPEPAAQIAVNCNNSTPVTLLSFEGEKAESGVLLKWITETEFNNDHFRVERSRDGFNFTSIAAVKGNGTSQLTHSYAYLDKGEIGEVVYYRLAQVDLDGTVHYSQTISIYGEGYYGYVIYPNPFATETILKVSSSAQRIISVRIFGAAGALVFEGSGYEANKEILLGRELKCGVYILEFNDGDNVKVVKLVKQ
jgi:uncharacterized repeat protein (TIGR01451 family)